MEMSKHVVTDPWVSPRAWAELQKWLCSPEVGGASLAPLAERIMSHNICILYLWTCVMFFFRSSTLALGVVFGGVWIRGEERGQESIFSVGKLATATIFPPSPMRRLQVGICSIFYRLSPSVCSEGTRKIERMKENGFFLCRVCPYHDLIHYKFVWLTHQRALEGDRKQNWIPGFAGWKWLIVALLYLRAKPHLRVPPPPSHTH